jgi:hypothetical protein
VLAEQGVGLCETFNLAILRNRHHQVAGVYAGGGVNTPDYFRHGVIRGKAFDQLLGDFFLGVPKGGECRLNRENSRHR